MSWRPWGSCTTRWTGEQSNTRFFYFSYIQQINLNGILLSRWNKSWEEMLVVTDVSSHLQSLGSKEDFAQIVEMSISTNFLGILSPRWSNAFEVHVISLLVCNHTKKLALGWLKLQWTVSCVKKFECNKASYCGALKSFRNASPSYALLNFMLEITN